MHALLQTASFSNIQNWWVKGYGWVMVSTYGFDSSYGYCGVSIGVNLALWL